MFCHFWQKIENSKWPPFLGRGNFFENCKDTLWVENFNKIAISHTVKEIEANLCFAIFGKYSKIQNGRHFWGGENFLKTAKITFLRYPVGKNFDKIALSRTVKKQICVLPFLAKNRKFKMAAIFGEGKFF